MNTCICGAKGFDLSVLGPTRCSFCDGTENGDEPTRAEIIEAWQQHAVYQQTTHSRNIEIIEKIIVNYKKLWNLHVSAAKALPKAARMYRIQCAHDCALKADGAENVLNALLAENPTNFYRPPKES